MEKVCSTKRDAAFTSSPPTEFVIYDHSKTPCYSPQTFDRGNRSLGGGTYSSEVYEGKEVKHTTLAPYLRPCPHTLHSTPQQA